MSAKFFCDRCQSEFYYDVAFRGVKRELDGHEAIIRAAAESLMPGGGNVYCQMCLVDIATKGVTTP